MDVCLSAGASFGATKSISGLGDQLLTTATTTMTTTPAETFAQQHGRDVSRVSTHSESIPHHSYLMFRVFEVHSDEEGSGLKLPLDASA